MTARQYYRSFFKRIVALNRNMRLPVRSGPDHDKHFTAVVKCDKNVIGEGEGHTKKAAQQAAAYNAILKIRQQK